MERDNLIKQLKKIGQTKAGGHAREAWVRDTRAELMAKAENDLREMPKVKTGDVKQLALALDMGTGWQKSFRPVVAAVVAVILVFGGWTATVSASYNSLPGERLYSVKIFNEGTQISLTPTKESKTKMRMDFAGRRLDEVAKLVESPVTEKEKRIEDAMNLFKKNIEDVEKDLDEIKTKKNSKKAVDVAKDVDRKAEEYEKTIKETMNKIPEQNKEKAKEAKAVVGEVGVKAVEVLLEKHLEGDNEDVSEEEMIEKLTKKLQTAEESIEELEQEEAAEGEEGDEEAAEGEEGDEEAAEGEEGDEEAAEGEEEVLEEDGDFEEAAEEVKEKLAEGKEMLDNKDLAGALDAVKEANTMVNSIESGEDVSGDEVAEEGDTGESGDESSEFSSSTEEVVDEEGVEEDGSVTTTDEIIE